MSPQAQILTVLLAHFTQRMSDPKIFKPFIMPCYAALAAGRRWFPLSG